MASQPMLKTEAAHTQRMTDVARAAEVAERFNGWHVFSSRDAKARLATRTGNQQPPTGDGTWAATVVADSWDDLDRQLTEQQQHDTERSHDYDNGHRMMDTLEARYPEDR